MTGQCAVHGGAINTDLERLQIGYTVSDALTVWAGRFHTPYGYWNTAFHHGAQIQTSVTRPRMIAFEDEGGIMPSHTVGLWATGRVGMGDGKLEYDAYVGNGSRTVDGVLDFNAVRDNDTNLLVGGSVRYRFGGVLDGLVLGGHGFTEKVSAYSVGMRDNTSDVSMAGAYGYYDGNDWEVIGEYYGFRDSNLGTAGGTHSSWAGFLQVGKNVDGIWLPYLRFEKAALDQGDYFFASQYSGRSYTRQVLGLRYDLGPKTALKFQLNRTDESRDGGAKYNEAQLQAAVRF
ncbi:hypothetical protein AAKU55_004277 [Oxalobacteraceae bacterium GrIS 1.11]